MLFWNKVRVIADYVRTATGPLECICDLNRLMNWQPSAQTHDNSSLTIFGFSPMHNAMHLDLATDADAVDHAYSPTPSSSRSLFCLQLHKDNNHVVWNVWCERIYFVLSWCLSYLNIELRFIWTVDTADQKSHCFAYTYIYLDNIFFFLPGHFVWDSCCCLLLNVVYLLGYK